MHHQEVNLMSASNKLSYRARIVHEFILVWTVESALVILWKHSTQGENAF